MNAGGAEDTRETDEQDFEAMWRTVPAMFIFKEFVRFTSLEKYRFAKPLNRFWKMAWKIFFWHKDYPLIALSRKEWTCWV